MRQIATAAAWAAPAPVTVVDGLASALPAADASFDAAAKPHARRPGLLLPPRPGEGSINER